jgi:cytochrome c oxidase assembly protein subunit 15
MIEHSHAEPASRRALRAACVALAVSTVGLIFLGGTVTSHNAGLAVPDWPNTFGYFMWSLPFSMWRGGVLYEHSHRVLASIVGLLTLVLAVWIWVADRRRWVRGLAVAALGTVILQGVLGGLTVLHRLPLPISVAHGVLAQTFLLLGILLAYSQFPGALARDRSAVSGSLRTGSLVLIGLLYIQLIVGAVMRHEMKTYGGVAVPDFPTVAGRWIPSFDAETLTWVQAYRARLVAAKGHDLIPDVGMRDVVVHVIHRAWALVVLAWAAGLAIAASRRSPRDPRVARLLGLVFVVLIIQALLGIWTVWSQKGETVASLHVMGGSIALGAAFLALLEAWPLRTAKDAVS